MARIAASAISILKTIPAATCSCCCCAVSSRRECLELWLSSVFIGGLLRLAHHYVPERPLHLFDTFQGFSARSSAAELQSVGSSAAQLPDTSARDVERFVQQQNENVKFHTGYLPESIPEAIRSQQFAFVHLDADLTEPISEGLRFFYPRVSRRGIIVVHDYNSWPGASCRR